jgi:hypothetical protein
VEQGTPKDSRHCERHIAKKYRNHLLKLIVAYGGRKRKNILALNLEANKKALSNLFG